MSLGGSRCDPDQRLLFSRATLQDQTAGLGLPAKMADRLPPADDSVNKGLKALESSQRQATRRGVDTEKTGVALG